MQQFHAIFMCKKTHPIRQFYPKLYAVFYTFSLLKSACILVQTLIPWQSSHRFHTMDSWPSKPR